MQEKGKDSVPHCLKKSILHRGTKNIKQKLRKKKITGRLTKNSSWQRSIKKHKKAKRSNGATNYRTLLTITSINIFT